MVVAVAVELAALGVMVLGAVVVLVGLAYKIQSQDQLLVN
jgi:hypothetical protein